jgi:diacylglycerol kinase (ATP)
MKWPTSIQFRNAWRGILDFYSMCSNARFHLTAAISAIVLGFVLDIGKLQWISILVAITLVWVSEMINEALETLCDKLHPEQDEAIRKVKDIASGAVLFSTILAVVVGILVFLPAIRYRFT